MRKQSGQSAVEFAVVISVLLLLIMGVVDFGRAFFAYNVVANAAREGARYGIIASRSASDIISYATTQATLAGVSVSVPSRGTAGNSADPVVVQASYSFTPITPLIGTLCCSGGPLNMVARSSMFVEP